jgi:hypothetical protein
MLAWHAASATRQLAASVHCAATVVHTLWLVEHACDALRHAAAAQPTLPAPCDAEHWPVSSAVTTCQLRIIVTLWFGDRKWSLSEGQIPNTDRRENERNGSIAHPKIPNVLIHRH